jgi:hypothetical protein
VFGCSNWSRELNVLRHSIFLLAGEPRPFLPSTTLYPPNHALSTSELRPSVSTCSELVEPPPTSDLLPFHTTDLQGHMPASSRSLHPQRTSVVQCAGEPRPLRDDKLRSSSPPSRRALHLCESVSLDLYAMASYARGFSPPCVGEPWPLRNGELGAASLLVSSSASFPINIELHRSVLGACCCVL